MEYYKVNKIYPWLYSIKDPQNVFCYLVMGSESALLFDTVYGIGDLPKTVRTITDKPVCVVLGHGHLDHANGAYQFEEAWAHEADFEVCRRDTSEEVRSATLRQLKEWGVAPPEDFDPEGYVKGGTGNLKKLMVGKVFDLGGLRLEVIGMGGHTAGSIGLLVKEHKVLLVSDSANTQTWIFRLESLSVKQYIAMLERVVKLDFDTFFMGHSDAPMPKSDFHKFINVARHASIEKAEPFPLLPELKGFIYREDGVEIVISERTLTGNN
jgi:glyoxylase-like metal-dependent hydrolase (beta-lactamase superfamily II)